MNLLNRHAVTLQCIAVILLGVLVYSNALDGAFQFDDKLNIVDNPLIRDLGSNWPPSGARWFGTLTFSLNYLAGGLNPFGYHLINITIHILMALTVYCFILLTFRTPFFRARGVSSIGTGWFACAAALLFVAHPIQTQAVTYIVQRFASLAALLYLLSLNCYIAARLHRTGTLSEQPITQRKQLPGRFLLYSAAVLFALLGMKTKENTITLPAVVVLYDLLFISDLRRLKEALRRRWLPAAGLAAALAVMAVAVSVRYDLPAHINSLRATNEISRYDYLITQFRVIVTYLRLLFVPVGQNVDHHYPVYHSIATPEVAASLAFLLLLAASAILLIRSSRNGEPRLRLISFGILWFFITLSIESGLIPIIDVMFEHRLYLPSVGVVLAVTTVFICLLERTRFTESLKQITAATVLAAVVAALGTAAHVRNRVWQTELSLWNDVIVKTPGNPRGYNMVGNYYRGGMRLHDAIAYYRKALAVDPGYAEARSNLGSSYIKIGMIDEGLNELMITLQNNRFDIIDTGILNYNIGKGLFRKGDTAQAVVYLTRALGMIPAEPAVHHQLAEVYRQQNRPDLAEGHLKRAHELDPLKY